MWKRVSEVGCHGISAGEEGSEVCKTFPPRSPSERPVFHLMHYIINSLISFSMTASLFLPGNTWTVGEGRGGEIGIDIYTLPCLK